MYLEKLNVSSKSRQEYLIARNDERGECFLYVGRTLAPYEVEYLLLTDAIPWFDSDEVVPHGNA